MQVLAGCIMINPVWDVSRFLNFLLFGKDSGCAHDLVLNSTTYIFFAEIVANFQNKQG